MAEQRLQVLPEIRRLDPFLPRRKQPRHDERFEWPWLLRLVHGALLLRSTLIVTGESIRQPARRAQEQPKSHAGLVPTNRSDLAIILGYCAPVHRLVRDDHAGLVPAHENRFMVSRSPDRFAGDSQQIDDLSPGKPLEEVRRPKLRLLRASHTRIGDTGNDVNLGENRHVDQEACGRAGDRNPGLRGSSGTARHGSGPA